MLGAFRRLGLPALLDRSPSPQRSAVLAMIAQRLLHPASKLATTRLWHCTTLAAELAGDELFPDNPDATSASIPKS